MIILFPMLFLILLMFYVEYVSKQHLVEKFSQLYLAGPTKCFSCEKQMINTYGSEGAWLGKQTKCFDCENQLASLNSDMGNLTNGTKCFDCENQYL